MASSNYQKSTRKDKPKGNPRRQCIYEIWDKRTDKRYRCKNKSVGMFFCKKHFATVTALEDCSYDPYDAVLTTR